MKFFQICKSEHLFFWFSKSSKCFERIHFFIGNINFCRNLKFRSIVNKTISVNYHLGVILINFKHEFYKLQSYKNSNFDKE
jgi:hypothetical protein